MADIREIREMIRKIVGAEMNLPITGTVTSLNGQSCTMKLKSGFKPSGVKLKATITETADGLIVYPKVGSTVLALPLNGSLDNMVIIKVNEAERISYIQDGLEVLFDSTDKKISIKNETVSLFDVCNELTALLKVFKVFTPVGPSGIPLPDTVAAIEQVETKFNQLLK